jgi:hypothetical protein
MTASHALPCPKCRRVLKPEWWHSSGGTCQGCKVDFEFIAFPALNFTPAKTVPKAVLVAEHATCFFHAENQAEVVCESCGRMLCAVCAIDYSGRRLCPSCISQSRTAPTQSSKPRVLYDGIALALAFFPMLLWPVTLVTSPIALGMVIYGWKKPGSIVATSRKKLVIVGILAVLQIAAWLVFFAYLIGKN